MISTTLFPGRYVQGTDSIQRLYTELSRFGKKAFAICTPFVFEKRLPVLQNDIQKFVQFNVEKFNRECSDEEIDRLSSIAEKHKSEVVPERKSIKHIKNNRLCLFFKTKI
jgi:glycerol dehydrogenase